MIISGHLTSSVINHCYSWQSAPVPASFTGTLRGYHPEKGYSDISDNSATLNPGDWELG
jgi:hypothetical protein